MQVWKESIDANPFEYFPSDRKKLLAFPFQQARLSETPQPKQGQYEWTLFKELYGNDWDKYEG